MKYRKKPVVIEAEQFIPEHKPWPDGVQSDASSPTGYGIFTLENTALKHEVTPGDWIVTGVVGEKYPCKDSVFRSTYDPVE
jgi:hypothetical protein